MINTCDLFISGSTGPLHIAGALNINTAAFYPSRLSATSLRWKTINTPAKQISFSAPSHLKQNNMEQINIHNCAEAISQMLKSINQETLEQ
jgi:ADP-heptose:LPS heptosyltransferase